MNIWQKGLTARQVLRVTRETDRRLGSAVRDMSRADYQAELAATRNELYPTI